jgi:hypothetical protein
MQACNEIEQKILENEELKSLILSLKNIEHLSVTFKEDLDEGQVKLSQHCDIIKTEINELTNKLNELVDESQKELSKEIEGYERNFHSKFDLVVSSNKHDTANLILEADSFLSKYSNRKEDDDDDDEDTLQKALLLAERLERETLEIEEKLADENLIKFESTYEELNFNLIGKFSNQNYDYVTKLSIVQFEISVFQEVTKPWVARVQALNSGNYILALYEDSKETFKIMTLDSDGNLLKKEENLLVLNQKLRKFKMIRFNDHTVVCYFSFLYGYYDMDPSEPFDYSEEKMAIYLLLKVDEDLKILNKINLGFGLNMMCSFEEEIFILSNLKYGGDFKMFIFDSNLKKVKEIGEDEEENEKREAIDGKCENKPFCFSTHINNFEVNASTFFLLEDYKIQMMDRTSGLVKKEISINSFNIFLLLNKYILCYNKLNHTLYYYDFDGSLYFTKKLDKISPKSYLVSVLDERLVFFDSESFIVYNFSV